MLRIIECAASGVLLVIPDESHVWRREKTDKRAQRQWRRRKAGEAAPSDQRRDNRVVQPL